jgi:hypothetical protein
MSIIADVLRKSLPDRCNESLLPFEVEEHPELDRLVAEEYATAHPEWRRELAAQATATQTAEQRFAELAEKWEYGTRFTSSVTRITKHPAYREIIAMGKQAVPFIVKRLEHGPVRWAWALREIEGASPVPAEAKHDEKRIRADVTSERSTRTI